MGILEKTPKIFKKTTKTVQNEWLEKGTKNAKKPGEEVNSAAYSTFKGPTADLCFAICWQSQDSAVDN